MINGYSLGERQARICRLAVLLFAAAALLNLAALLFAAATLGQLSCNTSDDCTMVQAPVLMLPESERGLVTASPAAEARLTAHVERLPVRLALGGLLLLEQLPMILLLAAVALGLRQLGSATRDPLGRALPWLRRAAITALLMALLTPLALSLRVMLLLHAVQPSWWLQIDLGSLLTNLLLALATLVVVWALAAGSQAGRDLDEIV